MVFKLVRIDAEAPNKIHLPLGTHLIGRGKFLDCDDKRISRNHGHLIITEDSVVIEALHQNPCFFSKKGSEEKQVVKKSSKENLDNGDRFGLLPGSYWYEVLQCTPETDSQATDVSNTQESNDTGVTSTNEEFNDKTLSENVTCNINEGEKSNEKDDNEDSMLDFDLNETLENAGRPESPSLLDQQNEPQQDSLQPMPSSPKHTTEQTDPPETIPEANPPQQESPKPTEVSNFPKRSHSIEADDGVKKIKTEPVDVKEELLLKQEPDAGDAGPSSLQADQAGASNAAPDGKAPPSPAPQAPDGKAPPSPAPQAPDGKAPPSPAPQAPDGKAPPSPAPQPPPPRERCIYGTNCYRRNPAHKAQFAHPRDADWGAGEQAPCPYGAACRRREPRHWRVHTHPPGTSPPVARPPPGAQVVERHGRVFYINAHAVNFYDDYFQVEDEDGDSVDFDYEF